MADYFETGFAVRKPSWHAKEQLLAEAPTLDTWRKAAGIEWEPVKVPLYLPAPVVGMNDEGAPIYGPAQASGSYAVVRNDRVDGLYSDDAATRDRAILARGVSEDYTPVEHERDMTPLIETLMTAAAAMGVGTEFTTAGSVREGKQVYACLLLDRPIEVPGDESLTLPYATLLNGHDGTMACRGGLTSVRVVCANTYAMADADMGGTGLYFTVRHTGDVASRLEEARQAIAGWLDALESYKGRMVALSALKADDEVVASWLDEFLPIVPGRMTPRQVENRTAERAVFATLLNDSPTTDGIRGTAYGLWQTTVEYLDHVRAWRSADAYLRRTMLEPQAAKAQSMERIAALCS